MLTKWTLANFKAIADKTTFNLAPITIFVGENSSGKSSVLQSILLLSQTLKATSSRQPLVLNGEYIRLGYMSDVVHEGLEEQPLQIGFELKAVTSNGIADKESKSERIEAEFKIGINSPTGDNREGSLSHFKMSRGQSDYLAIERTNLKAETILDEKEYTNLVIPSDVLNDIKTGAYDYTVKSISVSRGATPIANAYSLHSSLYHFLPKRILQPYNAFMVSIIQTLKIMQDFLEDKRAAVSDLNALSTVPPINLNDLKGTAGTRLRDEIKNALTIPRSSSLSRQLVNEEEFIKTWKQNLDASKTLEDWLRRLKLSDSPFIRRFATRLLWSRTKLEKEIPIKTDKFNGIGAKSIELPQALQETSSQIQDYFKEYVYYLGPLRDDPRSIYNLPPYPELKHVGLKGEFTASVLERFKGDIIEYPIPPEGSQTSYQNSEFIKVGKETLGNALQQWLVYMGLLDGASTKGMGKIGTQLSVYSKGVKRELDLTSIGVGVSQVLPTLVTGLIAPRGTTFLLEQPELHLHPRVQSMVADFLLGLTKVGKQCIVETHSEYLVNRIRRRVAEDETSALEKETQIYFVERRDGKSSFRALNLDEYGSLLEWPEGFFDEGPNEAELIMRAALRKEEKQEAKGNK